jgi:NosR/NirI family transcriptional regulator, nitrous oxide reductase regulator
MFGWMARYAYWLHTRWPAGTVEPLPEVRADGSTRVPGLYVTGDLTGIPLLKFALDSGARTARTIAADLARERDPAPAGTRDLVVIGAGVSGMAAALEASRLGLDVEVREAAEPFFTIVNFPRAKPIYTYPQAMQPAGSLQVRAAVKEALLDELRDQARGVPVTPGRVECVQRQGALLRVELAGGRVVPARRVIVAVGRAGDFRRLGVPGEDLPHVFNRLHDPADFRGRQALVVGGGDTALETALALALAGAHVTLAHRGREFPRARAANVDRLTLLARDPHAPVTLERPSSEQVTTAMPPSATAGGGRLALRLEARVTAIDSSGATLATGAGTETVPADVVFVMIGRDAPLGFLRRSGVAIAGERRAGAWIGFAAFLLFATALYNWKSGGWLDAVFRAHAWFPYDVPALLARAGGVLARAAAEPRTPIGTLAISATGPSFWYTLAYSTVVTVFGVRRIRRRRTPYVTAQTLTLVAIQVLPLFLLPELVLPLLGHNGLLPARFADALFPAAGYGHGREYWRAYGLILAWPLDVYNVFTPRPLPWWLVIACVQTLVLIPLAVWRFGKGAYCGWVCSCGALAETLGDTHRHKMPHGPGWNRLNLAGQAVLAIVTALLVVRVAGWILPAGNPAAALFAPLMERYKWGVDVFLAGVVGYGAYFWFSGRVWCRFFCPLAALMHVYARASRFRIVADKRRCISCGVCTAVCHQGIDVMSFANKGLPMADPQCVRCSACVHGCPTGVLRFGAVARGGEVIAVDRLMASPVQMRER